MTPEEALCYAASPEGIADAQDYLSAFHRLDAMIALKLARLDSLKEKAGRVSQLMTGLPSSGGPGDRTGSLAADMVDLEEEILREYSALIQRQQEIGQAIRRVPDEQQATVLEMRYLQGVSFVGIAMRLHYDERQIYRIHQKGLRHIAMQIAAGEIKKFYPV